MFRWKQIGNTSYPGTLMTAQSKVLVNIAFISANHTYTVKNAFVS